MNTFKNLLMVATLLVAACSPPQFEETVIDISSYEFADTTMRLEVLAAEPLLEAPVAMSFDNKGRIWALEMPDYMPNIEGDESVPTSRIIILEDKDHDGIMDHTKVFMDSLHQARAIAHVYGGLLYAESPNLWFVEIDNDKPKNKILVDSTYAVGGNVEHQSNGLVLNIDNWIYSAKCMKRYQRVDNEWKIEPSIRRGQWGISTDAYGRLYFNDNSNALYSDMAIPGLPSSNPYYQPRALLYKDIIKDRSIHPLHPTAINRGYTEGALDEDGLITAITSACGPVVYQGGVWGNGYHGNAFLCVPEANSIKRMNLDGESLQQTASNYYENTEFLRTTDEGFRPVNLFNGPDGNLYITDMHRGILQHKTYMTTYLIDQIKQRGLDKIKGMGRILRITPSKSSTKFAEIDLTAWSVDDLIETLGNDNAWLRIRAQHLLVTAYSPLINSKLRDQLNASNNPIESMHILRTLEGRGALRWDDLIDINNRINNSWLAAHAILMANSLPIENPVQANQWYSTLTARNDEIIDLHVMLSMNYIFKNDPATSNEILSTIMSRYPNNQAVAAAAVVSLNQEHVGIIEKLLSSSQVYIDQLANLKKNIEQDKVHSIYAKELPPEDSRGLTEGRILFNEHCASCHDIGGEGIENLAPALLDGHIVNHGPIYVVKTMLRGLSGPITVKGSKATFNAAMPGIMQNPAITDKDVMAIANYVSNAFSKNPSGIKVDQVSALRKQLSDSDQLLKEEDVLKK